jgi:hypothetical protein
MWYVIPHSFLINKNNLYYSQNTHGMIKPRRLQWFEQLKYAWEKYEMRPRFWYENSKRTGNLEDLDVEGRKIS